MANAINFLTKFQPFKHLDESELDAINDVITCQQYNRGNYLLKQNEAPSQYLYIVRTGAVRLVRDGQTVELLERGELFGYPSMMNQASPNLDAIVEIDSQICSIPENIFQQLMQDDPIFAEHFTHSFGERLKRTNRVESSMLGGNLTLDVSILAHRPPIFVEPTATVGETAHQMHANQVGSAIVNVDPIGIITENDLTNRVLAEGRGPETLVHEVMTQPVKTLPGDTPLYSAMLFMLEEGIHRIPLTRDGNIIGVVSVTDLLRHQTTSPFYIIRKLQDLQTPHDLNQYAIEVAQTVEPLFKGGLNVSQIGRIVASLNDALIKRLLKLAEAELGPPPTPYAWLVFGSEGRMEQLLLTDQDNALVYQDDTPEAKTYFALLSEKVVNGLINAGFPPCPGGYMATNWCYPLADWKYRFEEWIVVPDPQALLEAAIFFDFRAVHGDLSVTPLDNILLQAKEHQRFLAQLARSAMAFTPPLGFFHRVKKDDQGRIDLKKGGIAPIVSIARVYGLESGTYFPSTLERLEAAAANGALSENGADILSETFRFLLELRLETQLKAYKTGQVPSNKIIWNDLSTLDRRNLKEAFVTINDYQNYLSQRYHTGMLG